MKENEIRAAINDISREILADALAVFLAGDKVPGKAVAGMDKPELANFAQALLYLKKNFDFPELDFFSTEADLVYVRAGERRVLLTDRMNSPAPGIARDFEMDSGDAAFDNEIPGSVARDKAEQENHASGQDGGRFSNLEL